MELTLDEALQKAVEAHKTGQIQEAERFYTIILQSQPKHPDANHNLGLLAVSVNKADVALPLFKTALEANPKIEQFWLSYIDALIKEKQFDIAKQVLEQAKKQGVSREQLNTLKAQLFSETQIQNVISESPSQAQLSSLLEYYQNGRFSDAENLAISITEKFPKHQFGWKVLGAVLKQAGRVNESLVACQKSVELVPLDAEAHNNLGTALKELGRLDKAEIIFKQAIALKPDYAEAHNNLGNTLQELGRLEEAEARSVQAIALKPDYAEAHNNLGNTLQELGRLEEAEARFTQAIALKSDYAEAHSNLGNTLQELGRLEEAEARFTQAIALKPDYAEAHNNLGIMLKELGRLEEAEASYRQAISFKPDYTEAHCNLGIMLKLLIKYEEAIHHFDFVNTDLAAAHTLECLYMNKSYAEFDKRLHSLSASDNMNLRVAAVSSFAAHQLKKKDPYPFCKNPLDFIVINNLAEYGFYSNTLLDDIIKEADEYPLTWEARTTKFGFQGLGLVFENPSKAISLLESIVQQAVEAYYDKFKLESNLFIKSWPRKHKLVGWYNRLVKNGHHTSHIHATGWLSGVIYLKTTDLSSNDEGAIEFSLYGHNLPITDEEYPRKLHRPIRGDIVLFPSSLFHRTIPFTTDSERCVIAFDLMPA
jgi:tetratricopeptide (TPR) repeat protein